MEAENFVDAEEVDNVPEEATLDVLKDLHTLYEERLAHIRQTGNADTLQQQNGLLRRWVADLADQNCLLVHAVEDLETEAIAGLRTAYIRKLVKNRELLNLSEDLKKQDETIQSLRSKVDQSNRPVNTRDADVSASLCCSSHQCGDVEPVRDYSALLKEESEKYEVKMTQMEESLKKSTDSQCRLLQNNVALSEEAAGMRRMLCALHEQCRVQTLRAQFKDDIIREMRRQLKQAKNKLKEETAALNNSASVQQSAVSEPALAAAALAHGTGSTQAQHSRAGLERGDVGAEGEARAMMTPMMSRIMRDRGSEGDGDKKSNKSK